MAGGFAHVTAVDHAITRIDEAVGLSSTDKRAMTALVPFIELGSVAPDYPYLGFQSGWADLMHYNSTGDIIRHGIRTLRKTPTSQGRSRSLAWLMGYIGHVATDLTIHPIVEGMVGEYATHQTEHRQCEMNQDAFIWMRNGISGIGVAEYFQNFINHCSTSSGDLDPNVEALWRQMFQQTHPDYYKAEPPEFSKWNFRFKEIIDAIDDLGTLFPFTRHLLEDSAVVYPSAEAAGKSEFVLDLDTPEGKKNYDEIFDRAVGSILKLWSIAGEALNATSDQAAEAALARIPDGNLDTGRTLADKTLIFWTPLS